MDGDGCVGSPKVWGRFVAATYCRMSIIWGHSQPLGGFAERFRGRCFFASEKNFNTMVAAVLAAANVAAAATRPTNLRQRRHPNSATIQNWLLQSVSITVPVCA